MPDRHLPTGENNSQPLTSVTSPTPTPDFWHVFMPLPDFWHVFMSFMASVLVNLMAYTYKFPKQ